jgi:energy-coupling factor transport system permease protein
VRFHAVTWLVWAISAAAAVHLGPNPLLVAVVLGMAWVVVSVHSQHSALGRAFPVLLAVGAVFGVIKVVLTVATTHGVGEVLLTLPEATLPAIMGGFTVGGTVEDVVLARAAAEAFAIVGIMGAFGAFNSVVRHDELVASLPRAFHEPGVVLTVGLAFVPATVASVRQAQDSDRARTGGEVVRRGRLVRLAVPLLERGMERAVLLSESMESRGFARDRAGRADRLAAMVAFAGTLALGGAMLALVGNVPDLAAAALVAGMGLLAVSIALASRASTRSRYRARPVGPADIVVMATSVAVPVALVVLRAGGATDLVWPGDVLAAPGVDPAALAALAGLLVPALYAPPEPVGVGAPSAAAARHDGDGPAGDPHRWGPRAADDGRRTAGAGEPAGPSGGPLVVATGEPVALRPAGTTTGGVGDPT